MSILSLLRKEIAQQMISAKFAVMTLLILSLTLVSVSVMHRDYQLRLENYEILKPDGTATVAVKRPVLTSVLVKGMDERMGRSMEVENISTIRVGHSQRAANRLFSLFREVDFHFIALVVLSLAAVIFSFDTVSREKRLGTLKLMMANGVSRARILLSKWLGALIIVLLQTAIALLICLSYLHFAADESIGSDFYLRTGLFLLIIALYLAVFTGIGLLISCLTHRPSVSLIFALLVWAVLVFVVPNGAVMAGTLLSGGESLEQLQNKVDETWSREIFLFINKEPGKYPRSNEWANFYEDNKGPVGAVYHDYLNLAENRINWVRSLSYLSPSGPFSFASWAAAGTGPDDELAFKREVLRYHSVAVEDAYKLVWKKRGFKEVPEDFSARLFSSDTRPLSDALLQEILPGIGALALMAAILFAVSYFVFVRYDVR